MRTSSIVAILLGALCATAASARTFTSLKGVSIEAEITSATSTTVTLKERTGNKVTVPLDQLGPADNNYVQLWLTEHLPQLRVTPNFVRSTRTPRNASGSRKANSRQVQVLNMDVTFESWDSDRGLEDGELTYILVGRSMEHRNRYKILAVQTGNFMVPPGEKTEVPFRTVENYYEDNQNKTRGARCIGYVLYVKRKSDGRKIYSSASSTILEKSIETIINLQAGEETDDKFIKIPEPPANTKDSSEGVIKVE